MGIAAGIAGVVGAGASIATGAMQAGAARDAANKQAQQAKNSLQLQQQEFDQTQANLSPFMQAGQGALTQYGNLVGSNGAGAQQAAIDALKGNPLYTSLINQGNQAVLANASATGGLRSGNANYNLANFNANTLAQVYQSQLGNLGSLVNLGQNSAAGIGQFGANYANSASNIMGQLGSAQAGGILGSAGALSGGINSGLSQLFGGLSTAGTLGAFGGGNSLAQGVYNAGQPTLPASFGAPSYISGGDPYATEIPVF